MFIQPYVRWFLFHSMIPVVLGVVFGVWLGRRNSRETAWAVLLFGVLV